MCFYDNRLHSNQVSSHEMNLKAIQSQTGGGEGAPFTWAQWRNSVRLSWKAGGLGLPFQAQLDVRDNMVGEVVFACFFMPHPSGQSKQPVN